MKPLVALATAALIIASAGIAAAASPSLSLILPRGAQRGTEAVLTFSGARLADAEEILFYEPGVEVTAIEPVNDNQIKVTCKVAPDARLGEHTAQVRCLSGISDFRTFFVGALPEVDEKEPNNDFEAPQAIAMGVTVNGVANNEDVDYYVVEVKKGERISAEVEGMRLGSTMFDPYLAILDSRRFELAAADDTALAKQDTAVAVVAPEDSKYIIEIRESAYAGNGNCRYRLHIGSFPRPTAVYPAGGKLGEEMEVTFIGDPAGEFKQKFALPATPDPNFAVFAQDSLGIAPSENAFRLFEHGNAMEVEPNGDLQHATPAELPLAFNGVIGQPGDQDWFKFSAKKGEVYEVECFARRVRSPLDAVMNLYNATGGGVAGNDDSRGPDSYFRFAVPADGEYAICMTDHLGNGGPNFVYRIEFHPVRPDLTVSIPRVTRYGQERQQMAIPQGNRWATIISATRTNFGGEVLLDPKDLPPGVTMHAEPMNTSLNTMPVVFEAAADAPVGGKLIDFSAKSADPNVNVVGHFTNRADLVIGAPGQSLYVTKDVDRVAMAVIEELPFKIEIVEPKVPLVQNGSMQLKIVAHREEGFTKAINVEFPFRPPGMNANPTAQIPEGQNEVLYTLNAASNAAVGKWKVYALAYAENDGESKGRRRRRAPGSAMCSSQLATIEVAPPFVQLALNRTAVEKGKETTIHATIEHATPFEGEATVTLIGLPHKVTAPEMKFTKDTTELTFPVKTEGESPVGTHKNIFCQVVITQNAESVPHSVGSTELRIDEPLPPPKTETPPMPMPMAVAQQEPPKPPTEKPLTRLEQLRLEAQKRAEQGSN